MNLHEYQAKEILCKHGVAVPYGILASTPNEAQEAALKIEQVSNSKYWVVKAQIHAGGRGKGGGVKVAKSIEEVRELANAMIGIKVTAHIIHSKQ